MGNLRLPRLISDRMVLQRDKKGHIWGYDLPGRNITIDFLDKKYTCAVDENGVFDIYIDEHKYGGPYCMTIADDAGESVQIKDILIGEVWFCSGQSNMEFFMERDRDRFPEEFVNCHTANIRRFKISECASFKEPLEDTQSGEWVEPEDDVLGEFSALCYFFSKKLNGLTGIPVGYIDASIGGSPIHSWMGRDMLEGYEDKLALADKYADKEFYDSVLKANEEGTNKWQDKLDAMDKGLSEGWTKENLDDSDWEEVNLPDFFTNTPVGDVIGCVYFRKYFEVPAEAAGKAARLWVGTITDSDKTYINGELVGQTEYEYPPRKYTIREGLLHEGINNITVRVKVEKFIENSVGKYSAGRFTPDKIYSVFNDEMRADLSGVWKWKIGAVCEPGYRMDFANWKPVGLYNGMTYPCHKYVIGGVNWYQGESDCEEYYNYEDLFTRMMTGYRKYWKDDKLPVNVVQLPNFTIDNDPNSESWHRMRELLRTTAEKMDNAYSIVTIDLGEDNDIHPQEKRELGNRIAYMVANKLFEMDIPCQGPAIKQADICAGKEQSKIILRMNNVCDGLIIKAANNKGYDGVIRDFAVVTRDGRILETDSAIDGNDIILTTDAAGDEIEQIRYCYSQTNKGALIYNSVDLPMSPQIYYI